MHEPKLYILFQEIFYTARVRARFLLLKNRYIQGHLHDDVNSLDILMNFILNVEINSIN